MLAISFNACSDEDPTPNPDPTPGTEDFRYDIWIALDQHGGRDAMFKPSLEVWSPLMQINPK
jgi:hypothetical protein